MKLSKLSKILGLTTAFAISSQATLLIQQNKALADASTSLTNSVTKFTDSSQVKLLINQVLMGTGKSILNTGEYLLPGQGLISPNGRFAAALQSDGNFVLYDLASTTLWASNTLNTAVMHIVMQSDCNLVTYAFNTIPMWATDTSGLGSSCRLQVQDDGNLVIYRGDNVPLWARGTRL
ncbi:hypothetical protein FM036_25850 [Nostoc sp. HG1]|nr:hypothetical protein [Nostoc sp. HG1]MCL6754992.1 hypothetical protein [Nostoc sp. CCCryo 231-06]